MHGDPRFTELKRRLRVFVFPMSIAFFAWYLLYVLMSAFTRDLMATVVVGPVNVALVFGVLQFISTFGIAFAYSAYANRRLDPLANELRAELTRADEPESPDTATSGPHHPTDGGAAGDEGGER